MTDKERSKMSIDPLANKSNSDFDVKKFVGDEKVEPRRIAVNVFFNQKELDKVNTLVEKNFAGNRQAFFRSVILPELDKII